MPTAPIPSTVRQWPAVKARLAAPKQRENRHRDQQQRHKPNHDGAHLRRRGAQRNRVCVARFDDFHGLVAPAMHRALRRRALLVAGGVDKVQSWSRMIGPKHAPDLIRDPEHDPGHALPIAFCGASGRPCCKRNRRAPTGGGGNRRLSEPCQALRRPSAARFHCDTLSAIMRLDFIAAWLSWA
jgi:hypothetical protein